MEALGLSEAERVGLQMDFARILRGVGMLLDDVAGLERRGMFSVDEGLVLSEVQRLGVEWRRVAGTYKDFFTSARCSVGRVGCGEDRSGRPAGGKKGEGEAA